ncbi:MAG TPA: type II secretion system protein GspM [Allosphingosinicella sp.]|nr:type II secretion system protein GspM [Allosphingosinicella sp.]
MSWWMERSRREQRLIQIAAFLAVLVLGWLLVVRPLLDSLDAARARHAAAVVALGEARSRALPGNAPGAPAAGPVDALVARTANEAGFTNARITSQGAERASVAVEAARPQVLFGWVARLEQSGLRIERLLARTNSDRTIAAELTVRKRGG